MNHCNFYEEMMSCDEALQISCPLSSEAQLKVWYLLYNSLNVLCIIYRSVRILPECTRRHLLSYSLSSVRSFCMFAMIYLWWLPFVAVIDLLYMNSVNPLCLLQYCKLNAILEFHTLVLVAAYQNRCHPCH